MESSFTKSNISAGKSSKNMNVNLDEILAEAERFAQENNHRKYEFTAEQYEFVVKLRGLGLAWHKVADFYNKAYTDKIRSREIVRMAYRDYKKAE